MEHIPIEVEDIEVRLVSAPGDGMHVELAVPGNGGFPFAWVRTDEKQGVRVVVATDTGLFSMPLQKLESAIAVARRETRSEQRYPWPGEDE
jgi:hypothetical protein